MVVAREGWFGATPQMRELRNKDLRRAPIRVGISALTAVVGVGLAHNAGAGLNNVFHDVPFLQGINFDAPVQAAGTLFSHVPGTDGFASTIENVFPAVSNVASHDSLVTVAGLTEASAAFQLFGLGLSEGSRRLTHASERLQGHAERLAGAAATIGKVTRGHGEIRSDAPWYVPLVVGAAKGVSRAAFVAGAAATVAEGVGETAAAPVSETPWGLNDLIATGFLAAGYHPLVGRLTGRDRAALAISIAIPIIPASVGFGIYALAAHRVHPDALVQAPLTEKQEDASGSL